MKLIKNYLFLYFLPIFILGMDNIKEYNIELKILQSGEVEVNQEIISNYPIDIDIPYTISQGVKKRDINIKDITLLRDGRVEEYQKKFINSKYIRIITDKNIKKGKNSYIYNLFYTIGYGVSSYSNKFDIIKIDIKNSWKNKIQNILFKIKLPELLSNENTLIKSSIKSNIKWINSRYINIDIGEVSVDKKVSISLIYPTNILYQSGKVNSSISIKEQIFTTWNWFSIFLISIFTYKYWILLASDKFKRVIYPKYQSPLEVDILQASLLYNRFVTSRIFITAIIQLAQKGYIDIAKYNKSTTTTLYKVDKDTKGLSYEMRYLLNNILFPNEPVINIENKSNTQVERFIKGYKVINELLYAWSHREKYMENSPQRERKLFLTKILTISLPIILFGIYSSINLIGVDITILSIAHSLLIISTIYFMQINKTLTKIISTVFLIAISILFTKFYMKIELYNMIYSPIIPMLFTYIIISLTYKKIGRYTRKGAIAKAHLDGLEKFMREASMKDIQKRLLKDRTYLDKNLPYAILFNQSQKWVSFYHRLGVDTPKWYIGSKINTIKYFYEDMQKAIRKSIKEKK